MQCTPRMRNARPFYHAAMVFTFLALLAGSLGVDCDAEEKAVFLQTAVPEMADVLKASVIDAFPNGGGALFGGVIDGIAETIVTQQQPYLPGTGSSGSGSTAN